MFKEICSLKPRTYFCSFKKEAAITKCDFAAFGEYQCVAIGFLAFNMPMKVGNYFATSDSAMITERLAQFKNMC